MNVTNGLLCLILAAIIVGWNVEGENVARLVLVLARSAFIAAIIFFIGPANIAALFVFLWSRMAT
jgi:hypothetical protein